MEDNSAKVIGFYALSSVVEEAKKLPGVPFYPYLIDTHFPCIQLVYMAVHKDLQRTGHGTQVLGQIISDFVRIGQLIGTPALILTPANSDARRFYERVGFTSYDRNQRMALSLDEAIATVAEAAEEIEAEGDSQTQAEEPETNGTASA